MAMGQAVRSVVGPRQVYVPRRRGRPNLAWHNQWWYGIGQDGWWEDDYDYDEEDWYISPASQHPAEQEQWDVADEHELRLWDEYV